MHQNSLSPHLLGKVWEGTLPLTGIKHSITEGNKRNQNPNRPEITKEVKNTTMDSENQLQPVNQSATNVNCRNRRLTRTGVIRSW